MPHYSNKSKNILSTCHPLIQDVFNEVIKHFDCTILAGFRSFDEQNEAYESGKSQLKFPESKHNQDPSHAIDVAPYPINWSDRDRFHLFGGYVLATARQMGVQLRWGGDWDRDTETKDNGFDDLPHFELISTEKLPINMGKSDAVAQLTERLKFKEQENNELKNKMEKIRELTL